MSLPENGRIIIIDDKIEQALPLIKYLSKYRFPFKYFNGDLENLPEQGQGFNDIRVLFLDLNLIDDTTPEKPHFAKIKGVLNKVIESVSHPYLMVVWSRHQEKVREFESYVFDEVGGMISKKPCHIILADKPAYYELDGTEVSGSDFNDIKNEIDKELQQFPELKSILQWENTIHHVAHEVSSEIFNLQGTYQEWAQNTRNILGLFAQVSIGNHFSTSDNNTKVNSSFEVINQLFMDKLETNFYSLAKENIDFANARYENDISKKEINTKLLTGSIVKQDVFYPGVVSIINDFDLKNKILSKVLVSNIGLIISDKTLCNIQFCNLIQAEQIKRIAEKCNDIEGFNAFDKAQQRTLKKQIVDDFSKVTYTVKIADLNKVSKASFESEYINKSIYLIETCIDPLCDYVQNKLFHSKFIQGLMLEECFLEHVDKNSEAIYISPIFSYQGVKVFLIFDYRFLFTRPINTSSSSQDGSEFFFRLRSSLLADMQSKLSRHINRQGILYIDR
ncbi:TPA: hypothetical protein PVK16_002564 [Acinetobacter baumannii]|nr:hypothetical protein [Acinetobacter baumannii]HDK8955727.1 hypothetical protein [Acinetobacter baumannii]HDR2202780.1 hypothetical protein [Acinetobacter baumannii]